MRRVAEKKKLWPKLLMAVLAIGVAVFLFHEYVDWPQVREWMQHLEIGLSVGLSAADVLSVTHGPDEQPGPTQRALLRACDELHRDRRLGDDTSRDLRAALSDELLLEV